jgi:hypothetical protein
MSLLGKAKKATKKAAKAVQKNTKSGKLKGALSKAKSIGNALNPKTTYQSTKPLVSKAWKDAKKYTEMSERLPSNYVGETARHVLGNKFGTPIQQFMSNPWSYQNFHNVLGDMQYQSMRDMGINEEWSHKLSDPTKNVGENIGSIYQGRATGDNWSSLLGGGALNWSTIENDLRHYKNSMNPEIPSPVGGGTYGGLSSLGQERPTSMYNWSNPGGNNSLFNTGQGRFNNFKRRDSGNYF